MASDTDREIGAETTPPSPSLPILNHHTTDNTPHEEIVAYDFTCPICTSTTTCRLLLPVYPQEGATCLDCSETVLLTRPTRDGIDRLLGRVTPKSRNKAHDQYQAKLEELQRKGAIAAAHNQISRPCMDTDTIDVWLTRQSRIIGFLRETARQNSRSQLRYSRTHERIGTLQHAEFALLGIAFGVGGYTSLLTGVVPLDPSTLSTILLFGLAVWSFVSLVRAWWKLDATLTERGYEDLTVSDLVYGSPVEIMIPQFRVLGHGLSKLVQYGADRLGRGTIRPVAQSEYDRIVRRENER